MIIRSCATQSYKRVTEVQVEKAPRTEDALDAAVPAVQSAVRAVLHQHLPVRMSLRFQVQVIIRSCTDQSFKSVTEAQLKRLPGREDALVAAVPQAQSSEFVAYQVAIGASDTAGEPPEGGGRCMLGA